MTPDEQNLIENLFERLRQADGTPKDPQAEQLIRAKTTALPAAPYLLAQAVIVQEHALTNAQARIAELENHLASASQNAPAGGGGSFLSGVSRLFGGNKPATPPPVPQQGQYQQPPQYQQQPQYQQVPGTGGPGTPPPVPMAAPQAMPYPSTVNLAPSSGGGFLKSALTTAAGVAGGAALFQGIESLIGHNAGAFGPALGERGLAGGQTENTEIVNNYYDSPGSGEAGKERADYQPEVAQNDLDQNQNIDFDPNLTADNDSGQNDDFGGSDDFGSGSDDSLV
jgi:uncharacterized protein